jgi:hypothetical protein
MGENYELLMDYMGDSNNIEMFSSKAVQTLIEFKWTYYAKDI